MDTLLHNRLTLPYAELEELNLQAKEDRKNRVAADNIKEARQARCHPGRSVEVSDR